MYPTRFGLNHFMSLLAPGGYYTLNSVLFAVFVVWAVVPDIVAKTCSAIVGPGDWKMIFLMLIFVVISYFVGSLLRLPSVDELDFACSDYLLRKWLYSLLAQSRKSAWASFKAHWWAWVYHSELTDVHAKTVFESVGRERWLQILKDACGEKPFRDVIRRCAAEKGVSFDTQKDTGVLHESAVNGPPQTTDADGPQDAGSGKIHPEDLLWAADQFPYPLRHSRKAEREVAPGPYRDDFTNLVWPRLLDTMRGRFSDASTTRARFNYCKDFVRLHAPELAAELDEREALIRMVAGFWRGLRLGLLASALVFVLCLVGIVHSAIAGGGRGLSFFAIWLVSVFAGWFNVQSLAKIVNGFRILRMAESQTVFDSYIIAYNRAESIARAREINSPVVGRRE